MSEKPYKLGAGFPQWMDGGAHEITFIVTEDCNLRCKYCYQVNKNNDNRMNFEVAKKAIDYILNNREIFSAKAVTWDFIGGEPLLEIDLIDKIMDYIKIQTFKMDHPWFSMNRISFSTNGILYDNPKVQKFIAKNKMKCSFGLTIDGTKTKHDLQRVYPDGRGSYDDVVKNIPLWLKQFPFASTKVTFGSDDLKYLKESIIHLWELGIRIVPANVVFENAWKDGDDKIFEEQLKELADYIIDNKLWDKYETTLFEDRIGTPLKDETKQKNRCGAGTMLAIDAKGNFYPCLRYADYSLCDACGYVIGNVNDGLDFDKIRPFLGLTCEIQSDEECLNCEIAEGCAWCQGHCYDTTNGETNYIRAKYICKMHKARYRANEYYWGRLKEEYDICRDGRDSKSRYLYFIMDDNCIEHCNYTSSTKENVMSDEIIKNGFKFAEENFFTPVILNSKNAKNIKNLNEYSIFERYEIYSNETEAANNNQAKFKVVTPGTIDRVVDCSTCILNINSDEIGHIYECVEALFKNCNRINLNLKYNERNDIDLKLYEEQLLKVKELILNEFNKNHKLKQFSRITDDFYNKKMDNCGSGEKTYALAPNGKIYPCPRFYFEDKNSYIGDLECGIQKPEEKIFELEKAPICKQCDAYHCDRCVYLNKKFTKEYNTPSHKQCMISMTEKKVSYDLAQDLMKLEDGLEININDNFTDPIEKVFNPKEFNSYALNVYTK